MTGGDESNPWFVSPAARALEITNDYTAEDITRATDQLRSWRTLRDELAEAIRPHLEGYIRQARRRGRTPAELRMARTTLSRAVTAVHCRFADDWNILIELPPRLQGAIGTDPISRDLTSAVCQEVYAALLAADTSRDRFRVMWESTVQAVQAEQRFSQSRDDALRGLRERMDRNIFRLGDSISTSAEPPEPPRAITIADIHRAMLEMAQHAIYPLLYGRSPGMAALDVATPVGNTAEAEARGLALLRANLTPAQLAQYDERKSFEVVGSASGKRYRIRYKSTFNVDELDARGDSVRTLCFMPQGGLVMGDNLLAQKIALETDEAAALAVANVG